MKLQAFIAATALLAWAGMPGYSQDAEQARREARERLERRWAEVRRRADDTQKLKQLRQKEEELNQLLLRAMQKGESTEELKRELTKISQKAAELEQRLAAALRQERERHEPAHSLESGGAEQVWEGEVRLRTKLIVPEGTTLTIKPGTTVKISGDWSTYITVRGTLRATGTEKNPVTFDPLHPGYWGGIRFEGKKAGGILEHCVIVNGRHAAIWCKDGSSPAIRNSKIVNHVYYGIDGGIVCESGAAPLIERNLVTCTMKRNIPRAAVLVLNAAPVIRGNTFNNYTVGVQVGAKGEAAPRLDGNTLQKGVLNVLVEGAAPTLELQRVLFTDDIKFITSMTAQRRGSRNVVDIASWSGTYECGWSEAIGYRLDKTSETKNRDKCIMGEIKGLTTAGRVALGRASPSHSVCMPTVLSQLGRAGCEDTPEDILVVYEKRGSGEVVTWTSDHPKRGKFHVLNVDLTGDGMEELVVAQNGWCDQMGRIRVYALTRAERSERHPQRAEQKGPAQGNRRPAQKAPQEQALRLRLTLSSTTVQAGTSPRATVDFVNGFSEPITIVSPELHGTDFNHREPGGDLWLETTLVLLKDGTEVNGITASGHGRWTERMDKHLVHIEPGGRHTVTFPTLHRWELTEMLDTPGVYEINVSYLLHPEQPDIEVLPKQDVLWTGLVSSNTVTLTVTKKEQ